MLQDLNERLSQVIQAKRQFAKLSADLSAVEWQISHQSEKMKAFLKRLELEKIDVGKLEEASLKNLFYSVLGSRTEQLEKERQELLAAQLKFDQTRHHLKQLKEERDYLKRQIEKLEYKEEDYLQLLAEKEQFIQQSALSAAAELLSLTEDIANLTSEEKELSEAISAGKEVLRRLDPAIIALESAEGWGTWDMLGGGMLSTAVKHSKVDEARDHIHTVQTRLSHFQRELADLGEFTSLEIEITSFESFADYFFDGLIFDWVVQSKITDSLQQCRQLELKINHLFHKLTGTKNRVLKELRSVTEKKNKLIEQL